MSSEQELRLYKNLYNAIENIFKRKGKTSNLRELNINHDKLFISVIFRSAVKPQEDFLKWSDGEWIENMKLPEIYLFSFLYKKDISLYYIYNMTSNPELKLELLNSYKSLIKTVKFLESLEQASNLFIDKSIDLEKIKEKKLEIALNIKNYKDPKNLSNIIDLLYHKQFRDTLLDNLFKGINHIDIDVLKSFTEKADFYSDLIDKYLSKENISKCFIFLMALDMKGDVFVNKTIYNNVKNYIHEVISNSEETQKLFIHIEGLVKNSTRIFKNNVNLLIFDNTKDIIHEYKNSTNKLVYSSDVIKEFNLFTNGDYVKFKSVDLVKRIREIIFIVIQEIIMFSALEKEEKISKLNDFIKTYIISNIDNDQEFISIDKDPISVNLLPTKGEILLKIKDMVKDLYNSLQKDEEIQELITIKNEFIENMKYLPYLDFSKVKKEEFNIVYNLVVKIFKKPEQVKFLLIKFLNADIIKKYISDLEKDSGLQINPEIKKQIASKSLEALQEIVNMLIEAKDLSEIEKFIKFISKVIDFILYYALKFKSNNINQQVVKQKRFIAQRR